MNAKRTARTALALLLLGTAVGFAGPVPPGYLYGVVVTENGRSYTGLLRWGTEEAFWDDLFNSTKTELPYLEEYARTERRRSRIKVLGVTVGYRWEDHASSRMFMARFGDIQEIVMRRGEKIDVTMKDGTPFRLDGGSNDIGATIAIQDDALGEVKVPWDKIDRIRFQPAPRDLAPAAFRLYGVATTDSGTFEGYIQWDSQECLSTDKLDGESDDEHLSIEMGKIRSIQKRNRRGSEVVLKDGRKFVLEGTNDVDDSLRGVWVEDPRYGRVKISWEAWQRVEFKEVDHTGRGYGDYPAARPLRGTVTDYDDGSHSGDLIFDLDETFTFEIVNGEKDDVEYYIPFGLVRSIEPQRGNQSRVLLTNGEALVLGDSQDVSENNDGIVVLRENGRALYLPWDEVKKIELD